MKSDNKARDIFYGVVAIATLIVAMVGATLAYFSVTATSNEGAVNATAAIVSIEYNDGQQVTAQADQLIPATLDVVQEVYENTIKLIPDDEPMSENACTDINDRQVCSSYRFTISSQVNRTITATLKNEHNGFADLYYAVYDVTKGDWLSLNDSNDKALPLNTCSNENEEVEDNCYTVTGLLKTYEARAENSIFGYTTENSIDVYKNQELAVATQAYDLVIFLKEMNTNQNADQGKRYSGTIVIDVLEGSEGGTISGCVGDNCKEN